jgi:protoporphyrinogen oxidase
MNKETCKIHIIGAGLSGLVAAKVFEDNGYKPVILESTDSVGGRVKTDVVNGLPLDQGFQVLLKAYPAAKKYLDYEELDLQEFLPGALIFKDKKATAIGDPTREKSFLLPTLLSSVGSLFDKLKILKLNTLLKKKSLEDIFESKEQTTFQYLTDFGFSNRIIENFFKPFFTGIFLEPNLETSSRMFEFVYKMFGEGNAAIPKSGIHAIPKQLQKKLKTTEIKLNTNVLSVKDGEITLEDGSTISSDYTIITAGASKLVSNLRYDTVEWKSCQTIYFKTKERRIKKKIIGLVASQNTLINNIFYHSSLSPATENQEEWFSVTVVKDHTLSDDILISTVKRELDEYCNIKNTELIKLYTIPMALPKLSNLQYEMSASETRLTTNIFLAGDVQLNGSLNAAMIAGERAALGVMESISKFRFLDQ